jgi:hypothetical protein
MDKIIIKNNVYIVSKNTFPKKGEYYMLNDKVVCKFDDEEFDTVWKKRKIEFTTDERIISDGVKELKCISICQITKNSF